MDLVLHPRFRTAKTEPAAGNEQPFVPIDIKALLGIPVGYTRDSLILDFCESVPMRQNMTTNNKSAVTAIELLNG
jgi:hypothetical protein